MMKQQIRELEHEADMLHSSVDVFEKMKEEWLEKYKQQEEDVMKHEVQNRGLEKELQCCR